MGRRPARLGSLREVKVVGATTLLALTLIALFALAEKGPPAAIAYRGASPFNTGPMGTFRLVEVLRERYPQTVAVRSYEELDGFLRGAGRCLLVVVSPEVGYTREEAERVVEKLRLCERPAVLVADENVTSNALLEVLGSSARVSGEPLVDPVTRLPYVYAVISLPTNASYAILLDKASKVLASGNASTLGMTLSGEVVATLEEAGWARIAVLGDGSILLNQVLASNVAEYRGVLLDLVGYLCEGDGDCRVAVDGTRYEPLGIEEALGRGLGDVALYVDPLVLAAMVALRVVHPSTWLPWLLAQIGDLLEYAKGLALTSPLLVLVVAFYAYRYSSSAVRLVRDSRLEEQRELELYLTAELRDAVLRGKVSLGRQDLVRLFELVDSAVRLTRGVGLCDPEAAKVLPQDAASVRYARDMCRLYEKAMGKRRLPVVLSWGRTTKKMIAKSEAFLNALGQSLMEERGVEYLFLR